MLAPGAVQPPPLEFREQLTLLTELIQGLAPLSPLGLRKCFTELGQAIQGWLALPRDAAVQAMGPAIQAMRPTLRALGVSSHSTRLCATPPADSLEAARQLYRIITLLQTVALRPRMKFGAPASYIWIDDKVGNNHAEVEYITSRGAKPLQATTTQKAMELARQVGEENLGFITNSFRKDDGREKTVQNLLDAIRAEEMPMTPVLVYMGTDPAAFYLPMQAKQPLLLATMDAAVLRLFGDASFPLYDAEKLVDTIDQVLITTGAKHRAAQLLLTNFRLIFLDSPPFTTSQPWALLMEVPLGAVYKTEESAEKESGRVQVKLYCRDFRTLSFVLPRKNVKFSKTVTSYNTETMLATSMAGQFELESEDLSHPASWHIYSQGWDFERTFCTQSPHWTLHNQRDFDVCANYPENIVLPTGLSSADINALRKGRHYGALPTLSFYYRKNGAAVLRAASEALDLGEALGRPGDASILEKCIGLMGQRAVTIVDVGVTRVANVRASTMPSTVSRQYLDLGNTQDITNTLRKLLALRKTMLVGEWIESLSQIGYLELLQRILTCAQSLASMVMSGTTIIVQSDDGADMSALLVSLVELLLDPYYRTLAGFAFVVEREWLLHGSSLGWKRKRSKWNDELRLGAPFVVFLDCVWQLWCHDPTVFQFNEEYLLFLLGNLYSGRFGTFLVSSEYERQKHKISRRTFSIWQEVSCMASLYENPSYDSRADIMQYPVRWCPSLWHAYYLRHTDDLSLFDTLQRLTLMPKPDDGAPQPLKVENTLTYLPEDLVDLVPFAPLILNLSANYLAHLPMSLARQTQLRRLLLARNRFTSLQQGVTAALGRSLQSLTELDLTDNDLRSLPLDGFRSMRTLRLASNRLTELPAGLSKMTELAFLNVSRNAIVALPERLPTSLTIIEAESNSIAELPPDFSQKTNLQVLRLSCNDIAYFAPETFQHMGRLRILSVAQTYIGNQRQRGAVPQEERKLSALARQVTRTIPRPLKGGSGSGTGPGTLGGGGNSTLDVELCLPSSLPAAPLAELDLSNLSLPIAPSRVFLLTQLVELYLHHNRLTALSTEVSKLDRLRVLSLASNLITYIPLEIASCSALECLQLGHNQLRELTPVIGKLQNLTTLDLSSNPLKELPPSIGQLQRLKQLILDGLEVENVPKEILSLGDSSAVRGYLQDIARGSEPLWRVKLMVAGQENVGKTSLLRALTRKKVKHDGLATDGVQLDTWNIDVSPDDAARHLRLPHAKNLKPPAAITVATWDFAGQETYYAAHQFFLSDRSIYLLVWNLAKPDSEQRLTYWTQTISTRCPRSPIILVGTHLDDRICTEEYVAKALADADKRLRPLAPKLRVVRAVSCESFKGMEDLREEIESLVFSLEKIGEPVPSAYLALERFAQEERKVRQPPVLTFAAWSSIAQAWGLLDASSITAATSLLHNLGSICHYTHPQLKDLVILDPQWLVDVTSALFSVKHNFARNGMLAVSALAQIWRESRFPPSLHPYLVQLLERFELVFRITVDSAAAADTQQLLVPDLLPDVRPNTFTFHWPYTWHAQQQQDPSQRSYLPVSQVMLDPKNVRVALLGRRFDATFSPRGLFGRFMVRMLRFTRYLSLWKEGFVVEHEGGERLFATQSGDQYELFVAIDKGKTPALMQQAVEVFTGMLRTWYNVEYKSYVLCACCLVRNKPRASAVHAFPLTQITDAIVGGHSVIECGIEGTSVRIDQMAPELLFDNAPTLDLSEIQMGPKIGEGSYAVVHLGTLRGVKVAVKRMRVLGSIVEGMSKPGMASSPPLSPHEGEQSRDALSMFDDFRRELAMLAGLSHPNLLRLVGYITKPLCLVTEYMNAGDLWALARNTAVELPWAGRMLLAHHVASGVAYLHGITPPILHRDLKSPNILLQRDEANRVTAKLADLGLATALTSKTALGRVVDNPVWLAPEVLAGQEYAEAADIYSVAVIMWELAARTDFLTEVPFWAAKEQHVIAGGRSEVPAGTPSAMRDAIVRCWDNDPAKRPPMASVAQALLAALPPNTVCIVQPDIPPFTGQQPTSATDAQCSTSQKSSSDSSLPNSIPDDDDRPPSSASRDLLAITLVPRRADVEWTPPSIRSDPARAAQVRIGSPSRAVSPRSRTAPNLAQLTSTGSLSSSPSPSPPISAISASVSPLRSDSRGKLSALEERSRPPQP